MSPELGGGFLIHCTNREVHDCHLNDGGLFLAPFKSLKDASKGQPALIHTVVKDPGSPLLLAFQFPTRGHPVSRLHWVWLAGYFHARTTSWNRSPEGEGGPWSHWAVERAKGQSSLLAEA